MAGTKAISFLMDRSGSISAEDWVKQVQATASALSHPIVVQELERIFKRGDSVVFNAFQFNGRTTPLIGWTPIRNMADVQRFAATLNTHAQGATSGSTGMALAITTAGSSFAALETAFGGEFKWAEKIIDISSDGDPDDMKAAKLASEVFMNRYGIYSGKINGIGIGQKAYEALRDNIVTKPTGGRAWQTDWSNYPEIIAKKLREELIGGIEKPKDVQKTELKDGRPDAGGQKTELRKSSLDDVFIGHGLHQFATTKSADTGIRLS